MTLPADELSPRGGAFVAVVQSVTGGIFAGLMAGLGTGTGTSGTLCAACGGVIGLAMSPLLAWATSADPMRGGVISFSTSVVALASSWFLPSGLSLVGALILSLGTFVGVSVVLGPSTRLAGRPDRCAACGYSTAGLTSDICPECGGPIPLPVEDDATPVP